MNITVYVCMLYAYLFFGSSNQFFLKAHLPMALCHGSVNTCIVYLHTCTTVRCVSKPFTFRISTPSQSVFLWLSKSFSWLRISRQNAIRMQSAILRYCFTNAVRPSVRLSVCLTVCPIPVVCLYECTYRHTFWRLSRGIILVFFSPAPKF